MSLNISSDLCRSSRSVQIRAFQCSATKTRFDVTLGVWSVVDFPVALAPKRHEIIWPSQMHSSCIYSDRARGYHNVFVFNWEMAVSLFSNPLAWRTRGFLLGASFPEAIVFFCTYELFLSGFVVRVFTILDGQPSMGCQHHLPGLESMSFHVFKMVCLPWITSSAEAWNQFSSLPGRSSY